METPPSFLFCMLGLGRAEEPRGPVVWQGAVGKRWADCGEDLGSTQTSAAQQEPGQRLAPVRHAASSPGCTHRCFLCLPDPVLQREDSEPPVGRRRGTSAGAGTFKEASWQPRLYRKIWEFSTRENTASFQGLRVKYRRRQWLLLYLEAGGERECLPSFSLSL